MPVRKPQEDPKTAQEGTKSAARRARNVPRAPKSAPRVPPEHLESVPRPLSLQASEHLNLEAASAGAAKRKQFPTEPFKGLSRPGRLPVMPRTSLTPPFYDRPATSTDGPVKPFEGDLQVNHAVGGKNKSPLIGPFKRYTYYT